MADEASKAQSHQGAELPIQGRTTSPLVGATNFEVSIIKGNVVAGDPDSREMSSNKGKKVDGVLVVQASSKAEMYNVARNGLRSTAIGADQEMKIKVPADALFKGLDDKNGNPRFSTLAVDFNGAADNHAMPVFGNEVDFEIVSDKSGKPIIDNQGNVTISAVISAKDAQQIDRAGGFVTVIDPPKPLALGR